MSTRAEVVEEGAKVSQIVMWLLYSCIKPETSEINVTRHFHAIVKAEIFPVFPAFPMRTLGSLKYIF